MKILLVMLGSFFVALAVLGIFLPGLPTTPFLLLASGCYLRSSKRLYRWLTEQRVLGRYIREYRESRTIPRATRNGALVMMWGMILLTFFFFISSAVLRGVLIVAGITGTLVMGRLKTR